MAAAPGALPSGVTPGRSVRSAAGDHMVDPQHDHGPDDGHDQAVDVQTGHPGRAEEAEQKAADYGADNSQHDIQYHALACLVDDLAANEPGDQAENDPRQNRHHFDPFTERSFSECSRITQNTASTCRSYSGDAISIHHVRL